MAEFKTPTIKRCKTRIEDNPELQTPIKIPASPFLQQIGYGCGKETYQYLKLLLLSINIVLIYVNRSYCI